MDVSQGNYKKPTLTKKVTTKPRKPKHSGQKPKYNIPKRPAPPAHKQGEASPFGLAGFSRVEQRKVETQNQPLPVEYQAWAEQQAQYLQQQQHLQRPEQQQQLEGPGLNALHPLFGVFGYPNTFQNI